MPRRRRCRHAARTNRSRSRAVFFRPCMPCVTAWHPLRASNPEC
ncbi:hypothetical protein BURMUCGD1_0205 [Burkholderia multivorans CGD1]|nr:hypothetical protein BURMUCGD1_0205 [Burkholderia multivorans CGD1]